MKVVVCCIYILFLYSFSSANAQTKKASGDYEVIKKRYATLLGMRVKKVIEKLQIDTTRFFAFDEPPMILAGIEIELGDTLSLQCMVERTSLFGKARLPFRQQYKYIEHKKVIGISVFDKRTMQQYYISK